MRKTLLFLLISATLISVYGQGMPGGGGGGSAERSDKNFSFMPIPYISYNRSLGLSVGFLPVCMYKLSKKDTISPTSVSGAFGMYTTNNTWFGMAFSKFYLKEDKWRLTGAGGVGAVNFQFFFDNPISPQYIDYTTDMVFLQVEAQRKVYKSLYFGLNYTYLKFNTQYDTPVPELTQTTSTLHGLGLVLSHDKRDDVYYPHKGYISDINFKTFSGAFNDKESNKLEVDFNKFFEMKNKKNVVATRAYAGLALGDLDFNQMFIVGSSDIRGYSQGTFRGDQIVTLQGEYRWNPLPKLGFVGFVGGAMIFNGFNKDDNGRLLPGAGAGFRYNVFPKNHMNVGIDAAVGVDDWSLEFRIGEAF
jgi:outer membrane protein assembly factor BamA